METNNHFPSTGQSPLSSSSGLKQLPPLVEPVYTNNSLVLFPQQVKSLNCDMPVNGLISPSLPANTHGTFASGTSTASHPTSNNFDYLWKFPKSPILKDCHGPSLPKVNGSTSPVSHGPFYKGNSQDAWENSTSSCLASLSFIGQDLCNFSNINVKVASAANGTHCYSKAPQPASASILHVQADSPSSLCQDEQQVMEIDGAETLEDEEEAISPDVQPDQTSSEYDEENSPTLSVDPEPVSETVPLPSASDVSQIEDSSQLPAELGDSEDLSSESLGPCENELCHDAELPVQPASSPFYYSKEPDEETQENESSLVEALNMESSSSIANDPPVIEEESSDLVIAESDSPELGDCALQDASEMEESPDSPKETKSEEPESALESVLSEETDAEDTTQEPRVASPSPAKAVHPRKGKVTRKRRGSQCKQAPPPEEEFEHLEVKGTPGRRRIASPEEVRQPLLHGWKREVRIRKGHHRWQGETWYYAPCGKRMKQFPEVIKYLSKNNTDPRVRREHFSFSPRMPVGDFYEERPSTDGPQWILLNSEEIPSRILAITGKRGRPRNLEKAKARENKVKRGRGRPPKVKMIDLLNKADAKLLRKLENQDILSDVEKVQLSKLRKKMRRKARNQEAKQEAARKLKLREKREREKEEKKKEEQQKIREAELLAEKKAKEAERNAQKRKTRRRRRQKAPAAAPAPVVHKPDRKQLAQQRRLEERKRQQFMLEELKKPTEDMCLPEHQPLPDFPPVPGLVLPSCAFSDCLTTVEFLHAYGKVFGLNDAKDVPSLYTLQEGLFNVGDSLGEVQDLLVKLLRAALFDPGLPAYCQSLKILGEKVTEIGLTRENVSEALRIFLEAYGGDIDLCESLRTHPFQAHPPHIKASILAFIVNELNASNRIISEIDKTLECMSNYRKNKWIIEGKLRRLKFALSKKAGAQACQISSPEESVKKQSTHGTEEDEDLAEDKPGVLKTSADEGEEVSFNASTLDLERQMEKLTKRQTFLRKKILACSQRLRSASLGQDRYRRFYWLLPHIGGIFVEGYSESPGETPDPPPAELPEMASVKTEAVDASEDKCYITFTRSRGRPRKSKTDLEQYKFCQCRESQEVPINGLLPPNPPGFEQQQDLGQTNVLSWLTHCKNAILNSTVLTPENSPRSDTASAFEIGPCPGAIDTDEKENKLYNLLPRTHCTDPPHKHSPQPSHLLHPPSPATATPPAQASRLTDEQHTGADTPLPSVSVLCQICNKPIRNGMAGLHSSAQERRRGRPSRKRFSAIEQRYYSQLLQKPIPDDKKQAWWWIKDPAMLEALIKALHPRGIREKSLHKHLTKHLGHLKEMCSKAASDPIFEFQPAEGHPVSQETLDKWSVEQWSFQVDLQALQWVEGLEQRVLISDLQIRGWFPPSPGSVRTDLKYFEHTVDVTDDILAKVKREEVRLPREPDNPLDIAVLRLLDLEQNVERRYLKEPLWILSEVQNEKIVTTDPETMNTTEIQYSITPRMRLWRQTVERCRSAAQVTLCLTQLEKCLAWERSVRIVTCIYCRKGDNDEYLLLCDSCDRGCHTYCHRPPIAEIPEGDWFCRNCVSQQCEHEYLKPGGSSRRIKKSVQRYQDDSPIKPPRRKEPSTTSQQSPAESSAAKKRRIGTRSQSPDLTFCEIILMEMESHDDAWPFLEPVNPRLVPGYRKVIKNPMDFATMRNKLLNGRYSSCEEFAEDAELVFSNCQLFNEDESVVGKAGLVLKKFYESRWEEFNQERLNNSL
ncbi:bromodomain adjacent to zinc finger domain protein 2A isoform X2 [Hyperolius riggenbachi]